MHNHIKTVLKIFGIVVALLFVLWLGLAAFITYNKKQLLERLTTQLNSNINGKLTIESMEPALIQGFPGVSVSLKNVLLRDSLYEEHHRDLLKAREIFLALNVLSLLSGDIVVQKLSLKDGQVYFFTDSLGRSNNKIFTAGSHKSSSGGSNKKIKHLEIENVVFIQENKQRNKLFHFDIKSSDIDVKYQNGGWRGNINSSIFVRSLAFNMMRGSFIKNQPVKLDLDVNYATESGILNIPIQDISIGEENFEIGGTFRSTENNSDFKLTIIAAKIQLQNVVPLLTNNISVKLKPYKLSKPIFAKAILQGDLKKRGDPRILVAWKTDNNDLKVFNERVTDCSFEGYFDNEVKKGAGFKDENSVIGFSGVKGKYYNIRFTADTVRVINLKRPIFEGRFKSGFKLEQLNAVSGSKSFLFNGGQAALNIFYRAPFNKSNSVEPFIYGYLKLNNATVVYQPRDLRFTNIQGALRFKGQDVFLNNFNVKAGGNNFVMQGSLLNFLNLYYTSPERIRLDWHIQSPQINMQQFLSFLGQRKQSASNNGGGSSAARVFNQLDKVLDEATAHLELKAGKLNYRRFEARNIHSNILLKKSGVDLENISLNHADGSINITGSLTQTSARNPFQIKAAIRNVNVTKLFYAFENFGQDGLAYQNLRGSFFSTANVSGLMDQSGKVVPRSFKGTVSFDIKNGMLLNFEPMEKVGRFAFPNRNFSAINFTRLKNTLDINGGNINIRPMYIESSVLNLYVEGVYGIPSGTDLALRIPLRNPKKDEGLTDSLKRENFDKGIVINLLARDDETGNVKFKLGKSDKIEEREKEEKEKKKELKAEEKAIRKEERKKEALVQ